MLPLPRGATCMDMPNDVGPESGVMNRTMQVPDHQPQGTGWAARHHDSPGAQVTAEIEAEIEARGYPCPVRCWDGLGLMPTLPSGNTPGGDRSPKGR
eukprot:485839-Alexandrium_andersonii.AAC.1